MTPSGRIESETTRRIAVAAIMAVLLAAATGVAALMASGAQHRRNPDLTADALDTFRFDRPAEWRRTEMPADTAQAMGLTPGTLVFDEVGGFERRLTVMEVVSKDSMPLEPARHMRAAVLVLGSGGPERLMTVPRSERHGPTVAAISEAPYADADGELRHRVVAVMTVDGRRHLVVDLTGSSYATEQNLALIKRLLPTVRDARYTEITGPLTLDGTVIAPTKGLMALRRSSDAGGEKVIFVPSENPRFALLQALGLDVGVPFDLNNARIAGAAEEITSVPVEMLMSLDASLQTTPEARLSAAMVWRFWRATGVVPSAQLVNPIPLSAERALYEMTLNRAMRLPTYRALYGVVLDDRRAVLIEAVAEPGGAGVAQTAALLIALNLRTNPTPPPPNSPVNSPPLEPAS